MTADELRVHVERSLAAAERRIAELEDKDRDKGYRIDLLERKVEHLKGNLSRVSYQMRRI